MKIFLCLALDCYGMLAIDFRRHLNIILKKEKGTGISPWEAYHDTATSTTRGIFPSARTR